MEWGHCVWNENEMRTTSIQTKTYIHVGMTPSYMGKIISDFLRQLESEWDTRPRLGPLGMEQGHQCRTIVCNTLCKCKY